MIKGLGLSAKLYLGFGAVVAIAATLGLYAEVQLRSIKASAHYIEEDCVPGIVSIFKIRGLAKDDMRWTTAAFLADNAAGIAVEEEKIKANVAAVDQAWKEYEATITQPEDRKLYEAISHPREELRIARSHVLEFKKAGKKDEAEAALKQELRSAFAKYEEAVAALVDFNVRLVEASTHEISTDSDSATTGILVGLAAAVALSCAVGIILSRSISSALNAVISSLSSGSEQVAAASQQVSQSSQQMAEGASQQASSLEETSASLEEMSSMTRQNSDNARQANAMATETRQAVEKSREAMTRMGDAIGRIKGSSDQTAKIIKTIDEIAFQTNLLALNAAVEAARAGEAGKGFAVVAEEVRNLAQRSAEAARSTAVLIEESQQNANNGVAVSGEVAGILTGIVESVQKLTLLIGEVSTASEEQSKGIEQIGTAVTEMDKLTQSNAANAEESASASEELAAQARELGEMVQVLVGIVKGSSGAAPGNQAERTVRPRSAKPVAGASAPKASRASKPAADWSPSAKANGYGHANGHVAKAVVAGARPFNPDRVIPMTDEDLRNF